MSSGICFGHKCKAAFALIGLISFAVLASAPANAACTPPAVDAANPGAGTIVTCSGATTDQNGGSGYGTSDQTGITINVVDGATVTGTTVYGIRSGSAVVNNFGTITGVASGFVVELGAATLVNWGVVTGTANYAVLGPHDVTVTNQATGVITSGTGLRSTGGSIVVINSGAITAVDSSIFGVLNATVTNNAGATITAGIGGAIVGNLGFANVVNSGTITAAQEAIFATTSASVTNHGGASMKGQSGVVVDSGTATVQNSGTLTGELFDGIRSGANVVVTNNAGATISGGTYGIRAGTGNSTIVNAGTVSGGTAAISFAGSGNTLTLMPGSAITGNVLGGGANTLQLGGAGTASFDASAISSTKQYRGFGTLNKIGTSAWTLTGTSSFAGPVNVNQGTLSVNGNIASASAVTVNAGSTLGGNGTVGNTSVNGGTLAPGNSIGTLTVQGNLVFTAASSYMVEVSPTNADRVNVTGTATLGGATVNASFAPGSYIDKQYTILNASGGRTGTFGSLVNTNLPANFSAVLSYDPTRAYLDLTLNYTPVVPVTPSPPSPGAPAYVPLDQNQQAVGNAVVSYFNRTGGIPLVFGALNAAGLTQVSGEIATRTQQTTFDAMGLFMGLMTDPFTVGRDAGQGAVTGYADETMSYAAKRSPDEALAAITRKAPAAFESRWNVWAAGYGGSQRTDGNATIGSNTASSSIYATAVGADYWFSPATVAGFALAGGGTNFSVANAGSGRSDLFQAGAFVRHNVGSAYITAAAAYGWQDISTDRTLGGSRLQGRFNANAYSGRVEAGNRFVLPWFGGVGVTPYAAAQVTAFDLPAYAETVAGGVNTFALSYAGKTVTATRSELGLRGDKSYAVGDALLTLRGRAAWAHDFNVDRSVQATFQTLPGASFVVNGASPARDAALTTASAEMSFASGISLAATFEGAFSDVTTSYAGKGVARYQW